MGRLRANFARLGNPMQDCHLWKGPDDSSSTVMRQHLFLGRSPAALLSRAMR